MPTTYTDQFWVMDPFGPPPVGSLLTMQNFDIIDNNDNDLINRFSNDSIDGVDIRSSYVGDTVTVQLADGSTVTITGVTFYLQDGRQVFTPTDGSLLSDATLVSTSWVPNQSSVTTAQLLPICFAAGTLITTANGDRPVETLQAGDVILTADRGLVAICMVHAQVMSRDHLRQNPNHRPVCIPAGALGQGLPKRDLVVSPQHRMLICSDVAKRMYGHKEILVAACQLVGHQGIARVHTDDLVKYTHILLDHHGVIYADGAPSETLFMGEMVHENLSPREIMIIRSKLPKGAAKTMQPARTMVRGKRFRWLLERHQNNQKPLLDSSVITARTRARITDKRFA